MPPASNTALVDRLGRRLRPCWRCWCCCWRHCSLLAAGRRLRGSCDDDSSVGGGYDGDAAAALATDDDDDDCRFGKTNGWKYQRQRWVTMATATHDSGRTTPTWHEWNETLRADRDVKVVNSAAAAAVDVVMPPIAVVLLLATAASIVLLLLLLETADSR